MLVRTATGAEFQIDDDQEDILAMGGWTTHDGYIYRYVYQEGGRTRLWLHHAVLGTSPERGWHIDHVNGDRADNRRENLRRITPSQNAQNRPPRKSNGRHRGVSWNGDKGKWAARGTINYKTYHVGYFDTEEAAAEAIVAWRIENMTHSTQDEAVGN